MIQDGPVSYIANPSRKQLEDYFAIRHAGFREVMHWRNFSGAEDEFDRRARFVVVLDGRGQVIGGIRLIVHEPGSNTRLSLEDKDFVLDEAFPHLNLPEKSYFEAGRLALVETFRQGQAITGLFRHFIGLGQALGCQYLFASSPAVHARHYKQIFRMLGGDFLIDENPMPDKPLYEGTPHYLGFLDLQAMPCYSLNLPPLQCVGMDYRQAKPD